MKITILNAYKSIPKGVVFSPPPLCILTGINGSGKSHLLEAIALRDNSLIFDDTIQKTNVLYIKFGALTAKIEDTCEPLQITQQITLCWQQIHHSKEFIKHNVGENKQFSTIEDYLDRMEPTDSSIKVIKSIMTTTGKSIEDIIESDIVKHITFDTYNDPSIFSCRLAYIFKCYQYRKEKNDLSELRASREERPTHTFLNQSQFVKTYGPPPWELVDEILALANLPYQITKPDNFDFDGPYHVRLVDPKKDITISVEELSTGEKVLLSLAIAIYSTSAGGILPDLILLDEPDAPLHPHFSKMLIDILNEIVVKKHGINVIFSTHSPSTVALAPDDSVFEINALTRTPFIVKNSHALRTLTNGIEFLRVSFENRRQIFVESKNDVQYYQLIFQVLCRHHKFNFQPVFLELRESSNCTDVIRVVESMRNAGNDLVRGIIDWDTTNEPTDIISILGGGNRYAIENYILEPLYICLSLIRTGKKNYADFGVTREHLTYTDASDLTPAECQTMIDNILTKIGLPINDAKEAKLQNGFTLKYPYSFLTHNGHDYEDKLNDAFIELKSVARGQALKLGVLHTIKENPQFLPLEISETFTQLLDKNN